MIKTVDFYYCDRCGKEIDNNSIICENCGYDVSQQTNYRTIYVEADPDMSNKEIASRFCISEGTVKNYISSILAKENLSHRTALAVYYLTGKKQE